MAPPSESGGDWYAIVGPSIGITLISILAFVTSYFKKAAEPEATPAGAVASKAIGAAFVDESTQAAILRIDANVDTLAKLARDQEKRAHDDEIAERAAERAAEEIERRLKNRKDQ